MMRGPGRLDDALALLEGLDDQLDFLGEYLMSSAEVEELMALLNIRQMNAGKKANNQDIKPEYSPGTVLRKKKQGKIYAWVTLEDTGEFKDGIRVRVFANKAEILSEDSKSATLQERYTDEIFGLTDENLAKVREFLKPMFLQETRKYLKI